MSGGTRIKVSTAGFTHVDFVCFPRVWVGFLLTLKAYRQVKGMGIGCI